MSETCSVADQFCDAPANVIPGRYVRGQCYRCGLPVCRKCSTRRVYLRYGVVRLCNNCQKEIDGNDRRVMARLRKLAGY